jgi:hypothetical protein
MSVPPVCQATWLKREFKWYDDGKPLNKAYRIKNVHKHI